MPHIVKSDEGLIRSARREYDIALERLDAPLYRIDHTEDPVLQAQIDALLAKLPARWREVVIMRAEGLPFEQIAEFLGYANKSSAIKAYNRAREVILGTRSTRASSNLPEQHRWVSGEKYGCLCGVEYTDSNPKLQHRSHMNRVRRIANGMPVKPQ